MKSDAEEDDKRDAERYRWLRTRINWSEGEVGISTARTAPVLYSKYRNWTHCDVRPAALRPDSEHIDQYIDGQLDKGEV